MDELAADLRLALDPAQLLRQGGLDPDDWQEQLARSERSVLVLTGRQVGKTTAATAAVAHEALYRPGSLSLILAPTERQACELLDATRDLLIRAVPTLDATTNSATEVELSNGSRIIALPSDPRTIRGYPANLLVIDEAAFVDDDVFHAAVPMLLVTRGRIVALTTPNGPRGWFHQAWTKGGDDWQRIEIPNSDCPRVLPEELEKAKRQLPGPKYASEFECAFTDAIGAVFPYDHILAAQDPALEPLWKGGW
jgi:hypothetical protein